MLFHKEKLLELYSRLAVRFPFLHSRGAERRSGPTVCLG
jgi:hypothetical protein